VRLQTIKWAVSGLQLPGKSGARWRMSAEMYC
jgi:hypothetical protein